MLQAESATGGGRPAYTAADLIYDPATHTSVLPTGQPVPHVTEVLRATGVSTDFDAVARSSPRVAGAIARAGALGTAVHADCHAWDDDDLDPAQADPRVLPYLEAWVRVCGDKGLVPLAHGRERRVYHPLHNYTGTLDGVGTLADGRRVLFDIKTGDPKDAATHLQTAAYEAAWLCEHPLERIDARWAVWLRPECAVPYRVIDYTARPGSYRDFGTFLACLTVYWEQAVRRRL